MSPGRSGNKAPIDWDRAYLEPMAARGFVLIVSGVASKPTKVTLTPRSTGVVEEDYAPIEVLGEHDADDMAQIQDWHVALPEIEQYYGRIGVVLVGRTKQQHFPPKSSQ